jgi:hypothetical protein
MDFTLGPFVNVKSAFSCDAGLARPTQAGTGTRLRQTDVPP